MTSFAPRGYATITLRQTSTVSPVVSVLVRAHAAVKARNPAEAAQWFAKACQESPDDWQARAWLGQSLCSIGRCEEGTPHLREAGRGLLEDARGTTNIFVLVTVAPPIAGWLFDRNHDPYSPIVFAASLFACAALANWAFRVAKGKFTG